MKHKISYLEFSQDSVNLVRNNFESHQNILSEYVDRLLWWNAKINLVSRDVPRETVLNHVEHSLVLSQSTLFKSSDDIIDSGTGGGLPGIPLSILYPAKKFILNDIVSKKIMACKHIASGLKLNNVDSFIGSLEKISIKPGSIIISKHAFKINQLIEMIENEPWAGLILLKGKDEVEGELDEVQENLDITVYDLQKNFQNPFYNGKAMVEIKTKD